MDRAEAFGQHPNADIAYQIEDSWLVLESLLSLQPQTALAAGARSREDTVGTICSDLLEQVRTCARLFVSAHPGLLMGTEAPIMTPNSAHCPWFQCVIAHLHCTIPLHTYIRMQRCCLAHHRGPRCMIKDIHQMQLAITYCYFQRQAFALSSRYIRYQHRLTWRQ